MPALAVSALLHDRASASTNWPVRGSVSENDGGVTSTLVLVRITAIPVAASHPTMSASMAAASPIFTRTPSSRPIARPVVRIVSGPWITPLAGLRAPSTCTTAGALAAERSARSLDNERSEEVVMPAIVVCFTPSTDHPDGEYQSLISNH